MSLNWIISVPERGREVARALQPQRELTLVEDGERMLVLTDAGESISEIAGSTGLWLTSYKRVTGTTIVARVHRAMRLDGDLTLRLFRRRARHGTDGLLRSTDEMQLSTKDHLASSYDPLAPTVRP